MPIDNTLLPTPGRKTHVYFDLNTTFVSEPVINFNRPAQLMFQTDKGNIAGLTFLNGWAIKSYQEDYAILFEREEPGSYSLAPSLSTLEVAPDFEEIFINRMASTTEMPGTETNASANRAVQAFAAIRKKVPSGNFWDSNRLDADQTAFPFVSDDTIDDTTVLDRVAKSVENDSEEKDVFLSLYISNKKYSGNRNVARFYFNGPAGETDLGIGIGQYVVVIRESDTLTLYERDAAGDWLQRADFSLQMNVGSHFNLLIRKSKTCASSTDGGNGYIKFYCTSNPNANHKPGKGFGSALGEALINLGIEAISQSAINHFHYMVPRKSDFLPTTVAPLRFDLRRDLMAWFQLSWFKYPTSEIIARDEVFRIAVGNITEDDNFPFMLTWKACIPDGCALDLKLYDADTNTELTEIVELAGDNTKGYSPINKTNYYVKAFFTSNGLRTPVLFEYHIHRDALLRTPGEPSWEIGDATVPDSVIRDITIKGAERDLGHESAVVMVKDPLNTLDILKTRASIPMKIETEYDPADPTKRCVLFRGFMEQAIVERRPPGIQNKATGAEYPVTGWGIYTLHCKGIWSQIQENFSENPILSVLGSIGISVKVTDLVRLLLSQCGYDYEDDFIFEDLPIRIIPSDLDFSMKIDYLEKVDTVVSSLMRDYLNKILWFDANLGSSGKWIMYNPPTSPYTPLAKFVTTAPSSPPKVSHQSTSYPAITHPILGGTVRSWVRKPEANWIMVSSIQALNKETFVQYQDTWWNPLSYNVDDSVITADPSHPDYLGRRVPMYVIDPAIASGGNIQSTVSALLRRMERLVGHANKMISFTAPLVIIDNENEVGKKRILRYYDPIQVNGVDYLVRNVNPSYKRDGLQYAMYEAEAPRF